MHVPKFPGVDPKSHSRKRPRNVTFPTPSPRNSETSWKQLRSHSIQVIWNHWSHCQVPTSWRRHKAVACLLSHSKKYSSRNLERRWLKRNSSTQADAKQIPKWNKGDPSSGQVFTQLSSVLSLQQQISTIVYFLILKNKLNLECLYLTLNQKDFFKKRINKILFQYKEKPTDCFPFFWWPSQGATADNSSWSNS